MERPKFIPFIAALWMLSLSNTCLIFPHAFAQESIDSYLEEVEKLYNPSNLANLDKLLLLTEKSLSLRKTPLGLYYKAYFSSLSNNHNDAIKHYEYVTSLNPGFVAAYIGQGFSFYSIKSFSAARAAYVKALSIDSTNEVALLFMCELSLRELDYPAAISFALQSIDSNPAILDSYYCLGSAQMAAGHYSDSVKTLTWLLDNVPRFYDAIILRGLAKYRLGLYSEASADFRSALSINPKSKKALLLNAFALHSLSNTELNCDYINSLKLVSASAASTYADILFDEFCSSSK